MDGVINLLNHLLNALSGFELGALLCKLSCSNSLAICKAANTAILSWPDKPIC